MTRVAAVPDLVLSDGHAQGLADRLWQVGQSWTIGYLAAGDTFLTNTPARLQPSRSCEARRAALEHRQLRKRIGELQAVEGQFRARILDFMDIY